LSEKLTPEGSNSNPSRWQYGNPTDFLCPAAESGDDTAAKFMSRCARQHPAGGSTEPFRLERSMKEEKND
jgi:hypothetical protein